MKKFITARPEIPSAGLGSAFEPVLAGVAQGLARLFPPVESGHPSHGAKPGGGTLARAKGVGASGGGERG